MSTIAEHLAELEMLDANRTEGVSSPMVQAGYMFLIVHYAEMIQERDPAEMAKARETVEERLRQQHPARAEEHITAWRAARPALRAAGVLATDAAAVLRELVAATDAYEARHRVTSRVEYEAIEDRYFKAWDAARAHGVGVPRHETFSQNTPTGKVQP